MNAALESVLQDRKDTLAVTPRPAATDASHRMSSPEATAASFPTPWLYDFSHSRTGRLETAKYDLR